MIPKKVLEGLRVDMQEVANLAAATGVSYFKGAFRSKSFDGKAGPGPRPTSREAAARFADGAERRADEQRPHGRGDASGWYGRRGMKRFHTRKFTTKEAGPGAGRASICRNASSWVRPRSWRHRSMPG